MVSFDLDSPAGLPPLVVFSHLRWEFVTQRPQHLLSRMARQRPVLFVEEPIGFTPEDEGTVHIFSPAPGVTILQPRLRIDEPAWLGELAGLVQAYLNSHLWPAPVLWFYSAAFQQVIRSIPHCAVVYDCMDELSAFRGAPPALVEQERLLLSHADVVFTGGKSLYEAKCRLHGNVHCYPSSVDVAHFAQAMRENLLLPADLRDLPHPVVGYYGVIDERIDYTLLAEAAALRPDLSFVMIGPVVKVAPEELPRAANLHYLGGKDYADLPAYLGGFDVAMMPFALNESTRFISPTKTLEYLAGGKPVISTPITDVMRDYAAVIPIVKDAQQFLLALDALLTETQEEKALRMARYEDILSRVSWDKTAAAMEADIASAIRNKAESGDRNLLAAA